MNVHAYTYVCMRACVRAYVRACSHAAVLRARWFVLAQGITLADCVVGTGRKRPEEIGSKFIRVLGRAATSLCPLSSGPRPSPPSPLPDSSLYSFSLFFSRLLLLGTSRLRFSLSFSPLFAPYLLSFSPLLASVSLPPREKRSYELRKNTFQKIPNGIHFGVDFLSF